MNDSKYSQFPRSRLGMAGTNMTPICAQNTMKNALQIMSHAAYTSKTNEYYYAHVVHVNTSMISSKYTLFVHVYMCGVCISPDFKIINHG